MQSKGKSSARVALAALIAAGSTGCIPILSRDPRVTSGWSGEALVAVPLNPTSTPKVLQNLVDVNVSYGWASDSGRRPDVEVRLNAPLAVPFALQPGVYVHLPKSFTGPVDLGAGVVGSWTANAPLWYSVAGMLNSHGAGPIASVGRISKATTLAQIGDFYDATIYSVAYQQPDWHIRRGFIEYLDGVRSQPCTYDGCSVHTHVVSIGFASILESRRRTRRRR